MIVSNTTIINMITIVIDNAIGINYHLELSIVIVTEWRCNLEHHSTRVIYEHKFFIVQATESC